MLCCCLVCGVLDGKPLGWTGVENVDILAFELASNVQVRTFHSTLFLLLLDFYTDIMTASLQVCRVRAVCL